MPPMCPVFFGKAQDLALVVPVEIKTFLELTKGETKWVSLEELNELAKEFKAPNKKTGEDRQGILNGYGKRMHCMTLEALGFGKKYGKEAEKTLREIQKNW